MPDTIIQSTSIQPVEPKETRRRDFGAYALHILTEKTISVGEEIEKITDTSREIQQKIKDINAIIAALNSITTENGVNLDDHDRLQEMLKAAKEFCVDFDETKMEYHSYELDTLKETFALCKENFTNDNQEIMHKMSLVIQMMERVLELANATLKSHKACNSAFSQRIHGQ